MVLFSIRNGYQPLILNVIPAESVSKAFSATSISFVILTSEIIGGSAGPILAGILADRISLTAPLWVAAAAGLIAFMCTFGIKETAPNKKDYAKDISVSL